MNNYACGAFSLLILSVQFSVLSQPAFAQAATTSSSSTSGGAGTAVGPVYSQPNFECDARAQNLYSFMNPMSMDVAPWNTYQLEVQQYAVQANSERPPGWSPQNNSSSTPSPTTMVGGFGSVMQAFASVKGNMLNPSTSAGSPAAGSNATSGYGGTSGVGAANSQSGLSSVPGYSGTTGSSVGAAQSSIPQVSSSVNGAVVSVPGLVGE